MKARVCFIEDDPTIRELVSEKLRLHAYQVDGFDDAEQVLAALGESQWDLFIVDVLLAGDVSGLEFIEQLRLKDPAVPVLVVSALSEPSDRIEGLRSGADDYLGKPFEMEELLLRVDGMLKRRAWYTRMPANHARYEWCGRGIDFSTYEGWRDSKRFPLTQKECMLLKLLIEREGEIVSRDEILDKVWGYNVYPSTRTVDNFILRLRKLFDNPGEPRFLQSVRGLGYRFSIKETA